MMSKVAAFCNDFYSFRSFYCGVHWPSGLFHRQLGGNLTPLDKEPIKSTTSKHGNRNRPCSPVFGYQLIE